MEKKQNSKSESGLSSLKGQRYWSIMLVGEHGRVIPFRHFKELAIAVVGLMVLSVSAAVVLGVLYLHQVEQMNRLSDQIDELRSQSTQLKNERDVLKAKVVIKQLNEAPESPRVATAEAAETADESGEEISRPSSGQPSSSIKAEEEPAVKEAPPAVAVKWGADIKQFEAQYDHQRQILRATFRIYNESTPRERLTGRIVIAYRHSDDPPIKWLVIPNLPLKDGRPANYGGQAFSIRNYQTMDFKAYKPPNPSNYDLVTVFVLLSNGDLLMSRDFGVQIKEPPPPPKPESTPHTGPVDTGEEQGGAEPELGSEAQDESADHQGEAVPLKPAAAPSSQDASSAAPAAPALPGTSPSVPGASNNATEHQ